MIYKLHYLASVRRIAGVYFFFSFFFSFLHAICRCSVNALMVPVLSLFLRHSNPLLVLDSSSNKNVCLNIILKQRIFVELNCGEEKA